MDSNKNILRIMELEDAIEMAQHTIEFMHGCLTSPDRYKYAYPEHTLLNLEKLRNLYIPKEGCIHGVFHKDCDACNEKVNRIKKKVELQIKIDNEIKNSFKL